MRLRTLTALALSLALSLTLASSAYAADKRPAKKPESSKTSTRTYDLDFTLPTAGKSGCTVCHADKNLVRVEQGASRSLFVDTLVLQGSAHKDVACTGCHVDFAYKTPHVNVAKGDDWRAVAKLACKNCHAEEFSDFASGAHSPAPKPGQTAAQTRRERIAAGQPENTPLCGDCHGAHDIPSKEDTAAITAYRKRGLKICGDCHKQEAGAYADYYHGAAYRRGATDAPSCWQCHGTHRILPATDRDSMVHSSQLALTCGECHTQVDDEYVSYAELIHRKPDVLKSNPVWSAYDQTRKALKDAIRTIASWFDRGAV